MTRLEKILNEISDNENQYIVLIKCDVEINNNKKLFDIFSIINNFNNKEYIYTQKDVDTIVNFKVPRYSSIVYIKLSKGYRHDKNIDLKLCEEYEYRYVNKHYSDNEILEEIRAEEQIIYNIVNNI